MHCPDSESTIRLRGRLAASALSAALPAAALLLIVLLRELLLLRLRLLRRQLEPELGDLAVVV